METTDDQKKQDWPYKMYEPSAISRVIGGIFIISIGAVLLAHEMGVQFPSWLLAWEVLFILFGVYNLFKYSFKKLFPGAIPYEINYTLSFNPER